MSVPAKMRLAAWCLGRTVNSEVHAWSAQVLQALDDLCLVVIDPEDRQQAARLDHAYAIALDETPEYASTAEVMQVALRSLATGPKPEEPKGLGAVVEDDRGKKWTRVKDGWRWMWRDDHLGEQTSWDVVAGRSPRVLSEGWSE